MQTMADPPRQSLPSTRRSLTHKFAIAGHEGYLTIGLFDDGNPGEVFIKMPGTIFSSEGVPSPSSLRKDNGSSLIFCSVGVSGLKMV